jgi:hypothetical protein
MDLRTGIVSVRCHVAEGGKNFTVRGFRLVTLCRLQGVYSCWLGGGGGDGAWTNPNWFPARAPQTCT